MKLRIETHNAPSSFSFHNEFGIGNEQVCLPVRLQIQEQSQWCWASITQGIALYYFNKKLDQKTIVRTVLQTNEAESEPPNSKTTLDRALKNINCFSHWSLGKPSYDRIKFEINQGNPVGIRVEWKEGGGHYLLINGYVLDEEKLILEDPLFGSHTIEYLTFPGKYQASGVWTDTFWIKNQSDEMISE